MVDRITDQDSDVKNPGTANPAVWKRSAKKNLDKKKARGPSILIGFIVVVLNGVINTAPSEDILHPTRVGNPLEPTSEVVVEEGKKASFQGIYRENPVFNGRTAKINSGTYPDTNPIKKEEVNPNLNNVIVPNRISERSRMGVSDCRQIGTLKA